MLLVSACFLLVFILGRTFFLDRVTIRGRSMEPFFHEGDKVWISKIALRTQGVRAADTTLYSGIGHAPAKGDSVTLDSVTFRHYAHAIAVETGSKPVWLEGAAFWGDNRDHSVDSRHYGLIPKDKLLGVVMGAAKPRPFAKVWEND